MTPPVSSAVIGQVVHAVLGGAKKATEYLSPTLTVKATLHGDHDRRNRINTVLVTVGRPNYREVRFIKRCQRAGEPFPVKRIQTILGVVLVAAMLTGCASYQSSTLALPRDQAMMAIGEAHQACKDKKIPTTVCVRVDSLVKSASTGKANTADAVNLLKELLPYLSLIGG